MYFVSEAWHTCKAKLYGCAAVVTCQAHALGSGRDRYDKEYKPIDFMVKVSHECCSELECLGTE